MVKQCRAHLLPLLAGELLLRYVATNRGVHRAYLTTRKHLRGVAEQCGIAEVRNGHRRISSLRGRSTA
jgi:hypothetical protein